MVNRTISGAKMALPLIVGFMLTACATGSYKDNLPIQEYPALEVIKTHNKGNNAMIVQMIDLQTHRKYTALMNPNVLGDKYVRLKQGDRVKIAGDYQAGRTVPIANIRKIIQLTNPDKAKCESNSNQVWRPMGELQVPTCVPNR